MNFTDYQEWTRTTVAYPKSAEGEYVTAGLVSEIGELMGAAAKYHRGDYDFNEFLSRIEAELGDILWFIARYADFYDLGLQELAERNVDKLIDRKARGVIKGDGDKR